jgi:hypothetical protein
MGGDLVPDLPAIIESIDKAEVMSVYFPNLKKAVVVDTRTSDTDGPLICLLPMAASPQERLRSIRRMRPGFPAVRNLTVIPWPRYIESLVALGVWGRVIDRVAESGDDQAVAACDLVLDELRRLEKLALAAVLRSDDYRTIWAAADAD